MRIVAQVGLVALLLGAWLICCDVFCGEDAPCPVAIFP